ncbi:MAG: ABC1 kinase family protein [Verrucomicrobiales bacterium]
MSMQLPLNPKHWKQYRDIALLLARHGRSDLVKTAGLEEVLREEKKTGEGDLPAEAKSLAQDLEKMGPTFIKLGQLLSTRADLLPMAYLEALARLQDKVEPFEFERVEEILTAELGVRLSKAFSEFDSSPLAAASLGQVHRALMRDGREVVVKVQRPDIREKIVGDLDALMEVAEFLDRNTETGRKYEFTSTIEELRRSLLNELDYREEARNLSRLAENLKEFDRIVVPRPIDDYTTARVLTMEHIKGKKITAITPLRYIEIDGYTLADQLFGAYLKQILVDGFFHADPHPGNVFLTQDDHIALLDLGMVGRVTPELQERLLQLILAVAEGRADAAARIALQIGDPKEDFDERRFTRQVADLVGRHQNARITEMNVGRIILEIKKSAGESRISVPGELTLIGKALLNLDQIGNTLAPEFDPNESIRRYASSMTQQRLKASLSPGNLFSGVLELKEGLEQLPRRISTILERLAKNEVEIKVDAIDEQRLLEGFQKIANRITAGLILAALIVGAAMLMDIPTHFTLFGYPGLAMIFFLLAAGGGFFLVVDILWTDRKNRRNRK